MMGRVLVMSALPEELTVLHEELGDAEFVDIGRHRFTSGTIAGRDVVATTSGIGKVNAAMVAVLAIESFEPSSLIFTGVAGGLDEALEIGDVVIAERVVQHDTGVLESDGLHRYQPGHIPFLNPTDRFGYSPSPELLEGARMAAQRVTLNPVLGRIPRVVGGVIATGDQFITSGDMRRRLARDLGARAVEMEGGAVTQVADRFGVDCVVIRALSDHAGRDAPTNFGRFVSEVAANSVRLVSAMVASG